MAASGKSKSSTDHPRLDRPFEKSILDRAATIARQYKIVLEIEDGIWYGHGLEFPTVFGDGKSPTAAVADTRQALELAVAYLLESGQSPPTATLKRHRSVQVNVRLSAREKALLESRAKARGFRGLSDFYSHIPVK